MRTSALPWTGLDAVAPTTPPVTVTTARTGTMSSTTSPVAHDATTTPRRTTDTARRSSVLPAGAGALQQVLRRTAENQATQLPASRDRRASIDGSTPSDDTTSNNGRASTTHTTSSDHTTSTDAPEGSIAPVVARRMTAGTPAPTEPARSSTDTRPAERLADQFMTELSQTVRRTPAPLPMPFRPMSDAITGGRRVMLSTDPASRRALRSVGKIAATTGDTIHLDHAAIPRRRLDEVVAHELTHVAHPSPTPRFFDDIDDSPEERRAEKVASIMARSPLAPSSTVAAPRGSSTIRRSAASSSSGGSSSSSSGTISADALAARLTGSGAAAAPSRSVTRAPAVIRRSHAAVSAPPVSAPAVSSAPEQRNVIRRTLSEGTGSAPESTADLNTLIDERIAANVDSLLRKIEDRMIVELERRGGRSWRSS